MTNYYYKYYNKLSSEVVRYLEEVIVKTYCYNNQGLISLISNNEVNKEKNSYMNEEEIHVNNTKLISDDIMELYQINDNVFVQELIVDYETNIITKYTYDKYNNILESNVYSVENQTDAIMKKNYQYNNDCWGDLLTSFNGEDITYDSIGNPLNYIIGKSFEWSGRQLVNIHGDNEIIYEYNNEGIRLNKIINGTKTEYFIEGQDIIAEKLKEKQFTIYTIHMQT